MSALGDYVHLSLRNYIKYGIDKSSSGNEEKAQFIFNEYRKRRLEEINDISQETINELRMRTRNDSEMQQNRDELHSQENFQRVVDMATIEISKTATKDLMNSFQREPDNHFTASRIAQRQIQKNTVKNAQGQNIGSPRLSKLLGEKKAILEKINKINAGKYTTSEGLQAALQSILDSYTKIDNGLQSIRQLGLQPEAAKFFSEENVGNNVSVQTNGGVTTAYLSTQEAQSVLGKIQNALNGLTYTTVFNMLKGDFGEQLIYCARDASYYTGVRNANNEIEKVCGGHESQILFSPSDLVVDLAEYDKYYKTMETTVEGKSKQIYQLKTTKDKVDVSIIINQENMFASVKNYRDLNNMANTGMRLQKDINILYALIGLNNLKYLENFGNHYLNLHAHERNVATNNNLTDELEESEKILKYEVAYEALASGNPLKATKERANTFVVIERKTGQVYAFSTKKMLEENGADLNNFNFSPESIFSREYLNEYQDSVEARLANVLMQVHKAKVSVYYKASALQRDSI